ncbi:MAG: methyltransferase domain-containing protein [Mucinivorans sp.]
MQKRHLDRQTYFNELASTSQEYYIDYLAPYKKLGPGVRVLEIGCAEGGNLLPFAQAGCTVRGIDLTAQRIEQAKEFFAAKGCTGSFSTMDFLLMEPQIGQQYDIILIHDVIEHVLQKELFIAHIDPFLAPSGVIFWRFPAWQMPFGGHQQICHGHLSSHLPWSHLLPQGLYGALLHAMGESDRCVEELRQIKECRMPISRFERLMKKGGYAILNRTLWFINPHYQQKFNLRPRRLYPVVSRMRYLRNFFSTSCYYITRKAE